MMKIMICLNKTSRILKNLISEPILKSEIKQLKLFINLHNNLHRTKRYSTKTAQIPDNEIINDLKTDEGVWRRQYWKMKTVSFA